MDYLDDVSDTLDPESEDFDPQIHEFVSAALANRVDLRKWPDVATLLNALDAVASALFDLKYSLEHDEQNTTEPAVS